MKRKTQADLEILKAQYRYGMVLIGMSIINFEANCDKKRQVANGAEYNETEPSIEDIENRISKFTEAISPVLLPMIVSLGSSEFES